MKVLIVGEKGVGKTSLLSALATPSQSDLRTSPPTSPPLSSKVPAAPYQLQDVASATKPPSFDHFTVYTRIGEDAAVQLDM